MTRYSTVEIDFVADDPGPSLLHCHHQDHPGRRLHGDGHISLIRTSEQTISNIEDQHALPVTDDGPSNAASGEGAAESGKNEITLVQGFVFRGRCS